MYSEYVFVAVVIQHAKRMRRVLLPSLACPVLPFISPLSHKRNDFLKKLFCIKCLFGFSLYLFLYRLRKDQ